MAKKIPLPSTDIKFPDPKILPKESEGLLFVGGALNTRNLLSAYKKGIYPWPLDETYPVFWFCPEPRGVLDFQDLHLPKSLQKIRKKNLYRFSFNTAFLSVINQCQKQPRPGQEGTWITEAMKEAYCNFHADGYAHSIECWNQEGTLVAGIYGVYVDGVFSGESMFHIESNCSKLCLIELVLKLQSLGLKWIDTQMLTPVTEQLGGKYISRQDFLKRIEKVHKQKPSSKISLL
ncbi:MAG: leucyl/phenylalanyl-tRNA--protein transferase [Oligoflexia bacterium]|nr:leucyl/phenylalanyl-tRNA--protein transferase [Oligoflexia bacterium]